MSETFYPDQNSEAVIAQISAPEAETGIEQNSQNLLQSALNVARGVAERFSSRKFAVGFATGALSVGGAVAIEGVPTFANAATSSRACEVYRNAKPKMDFKLIGPKYINEDSNTPFTIVETSRTSLKGVKIIIDSLQDYTFTDNVKPGVLIQHNIVEKYPALPQQHRSEGGIFTENISITAIKDKKVIAHKFFSPMHPPAISGSTTQG
ncbi:MAG: hypothetical protein QFB86_04190 [Patescibacteria group bacterium]|nr:hypothetical protein [Patescibacteria group bacterium]